MNNLKISAVPVLLFVASSTLVSLTLVLTGCADRESADRTASSSSSSEPHADHDHDHGHGDHSKKAGPNGGHLIELGRDHAWHAELTDDHATNTVTIYMLDADMKPMPIEQTSISLTLMQIGESKTFELAGDGSKFSLSDESMLEMLEEEGTQGKLRVMIDGTPLTGTFSHHEHEEHEHGDHDHGDHDH